LEKLNWHPIENFDRLKNKLQVKDTEDAKARIATTYSNTDVDEVYGTTNGGTGVAANKIIKPTKSSYRSSSTADIKLKEDELPLLSG